MTAALTMTGAPPLWLPWQAILAAAIIAGVLLGLGLYYLADRVMFLWGANVREMRHAWWRACRQREGSDWRERAYARVGDRVAARMAELEAEPPMSPEEFDEAMRRNKETAEAYLYQQGRAAFGDQGGS